MATLNGNCGLAPILYVLGMAEFREKLEAFWKGIRTKKQVVPSQDVSLDITGTSPDTFDADPDPVALDVDDLPVVCPPSTPDAQGGPKIEKSLQFSVPRRCKYRLPNYSD